MARFVPKLISPTMTISTEAPLTSVLDEIRHRVEAATRKAHDLHEVVPADEAMRVHNELAAVIAQLDPAEERWLELQAELEEAAKDLPDSMDVPIWQAEVLLQKSPKQEKRARAQEKRARELLVRLRDAHRDRTPGRARHHDGADHLQERDDEHHGEVDAPVRRRRDDDGHRGVTEHLERHAGEVERHEHFRW